LYDFVRGVHRVLRSNLTNAEDFNTSFNVDSFDSDGFTVIGNSVETNATTDNYVAWCFNAGTGAAAQNTDGTITSTVKANQAAGFSICSWTATSNSSDTIGHGLNSTPQLIIYKKRNGTSQWSAYSNVIDGSWDLLRLNTTEAKVDSSSTWGTDTTIKSNSSSSGGTWITYCFHSVTGYQKIGSYSGGQTLNTDNIVDFGFTPRFVIVKNITATTGWLMIDSIRPNGYALFANDAGAEADYSGHIKLSSSGLRFDGNNNNVNASGNNYIYLAIA